MKKILKVLAAGVLVASALTVVACKDDNTSTTLIPTSSPTTSAPTTSAPTTIVPTTVAPTTTVAAVKLATPVVTLEGSVVSWSAIENASGYIVTFNNAPLPAQSETSYQITANETGDYKVTVQAVSNNLELYTNSDLSNEVIYTYTGSVVKEAHTLYIVGDSTLASFNDSYYYPRYGYGTQLGNYFDDMITVNNLALSGRSSKSYIVEENYTTLKNNIKAGDYLLIGFGHNDEKNDDATRFTDASKPTEDSTSFKYSLNEYYLKLASEKGATPILCTPIVRANSSNDYTGSSGHVTANGDYAKAIVELGQEKDVAVVNLRDITKNEYTSIGYDEAIYYHAMTAGIYDTDGTTIIPLTSSVDNTHLNIYGAKYVAYEVAYTLKNSTSSLGQYVKEEIARPVKANDLVANSSYKVSAYKAPDLSTYKAPDQFKTISEGWYGTAFGDCGGSPISSSNGFVAKETTEGVFTVGQTGSSSKGKFAGSSDGFAYLFRQVDASKNFEITAEAKVLTTGKTKQAGFGLMIRDDCYVNLSDKTLPNYANYLAAGLVTTETNMNVLFGRESGSLKKENNVIDSLYQANDTATLKIVRLGQVITISVTYKGQTYTKDYPDFDLLSVDSKYIYVGMFANRGTTVEFTNVNFTITGEAQGA